MTQKILTQAMKAKEMSDDLMLQLDGIAGGLTGAQLYKIGTLIMTHVAEREAQAVQREREAAKLVLEQLQNLNDQQGSTLRNQHITSYDKEKYLLNNVVESERTILAALATYNDNRKG